MAEQAPEKLPEPGDPRAFYVIDLQHFVFKHVAATGMRAVDGFARWFESLLAQRRPARIACADDAAGGSYRVDILREAGFVGADGYKANRRRLSDEDVAVLQDQREQVREYLGDLGVPVVMAPGFEADDVIATIARWAARPWCACECGSLAPGTSDDDQSILCAACGSWAGIVEAWRPAARVVIVSADHDLLQLVGASPSGGSCVEWDGAFMVRGPKGCREALGVPPERVADFFAIKGGKNNVPGVRGLGEVRAAALLQKASLETWLADPPVDRLYEFYATTGGCIRGAWVDALRAEADRARLGLRLTRLRDDVPLDFARLARECRFSIASSACSG